MPKRHRSSFDWALLLEDANFSTEEKQKEPTSRVISRARAGRPQKKGPRPAAEEGFIFHSDQFKPKSYLKLIKKYMFSEGEQFPLSSIFSTALQGDKLLSSIRAGSPYVAWYVTCVLRKSRCQWWCAT